MILFRMIHHKVYAVVLNWNSYRAARACVRSLERLDCALAGIVLVDNGSADGSAALLEREFPAYPLLRTGRNLGYGDGNDQGIRRALAEGADLVWVLNPDVVAARDSLRRMLELLDSDRAIGVCGPRIALPAAPGRPVYDGMDLEPARGFLPDYRWVRPGPPGKAARGAGYRGLSAPPSRACGYVAGCSLLARREVFEAVGLFRDDLFMYLEDAEFCLRARDAGWKVAVAPAALNWHLQPGSPPGIMFLLARNAVWLARLRGEGVLATVSGILRRRGIFAFRRDGLLRPYAPLLRGVWAGLRRPRF